MKCPYCNFDESNVLESRDAMDGKATRRRRECLKCSKRFTTYEKVGSIELKVVKKDGRIEDYRREKLERCFEKACWKLTSEERSKIIDEIEWVLDLVSDPRGLYPVCHHLYGSEEYRRF